MNVRNYRNFNQQHFNDDLFHHLTLLNWETNDPNILWNNFEKTFNYVSDTHAPLRSKRVRSQKTPWLTDTIKLDMNRRGYLKKKAVKNNSLWYHNAYKALRNKINKDVICAKRKHYVKSIEENMGNPKLMWKHLNCLLNRKSKRTGVQAIKTDEGDVVESQKIAELFNEYFSNIGPTLSNQITSISSQGFESYMTHEASEIFEFATVDSTIVLNELEKLLNSSKSTGPDNIPVKLLKDSKETVSPFLAYVFNTSLCSGIFPDNLKVARVSPIYKEGDKKERGNYRPIPVISTVAKLFENLVCIQLTDYLNANDILSPYREILIKKLKIYGVQNNALKWFISYLFDRKQFCKVGSAASSTKNIRCGVPQGSNLGPLLFLLYVNDLPNCLRYSSAEMYADDTNLTACSDNINNLQAILNWDLNNIHQWIATNKLTLNVGKTEYMIIGTRQKLKNFSSEMNINIGGKNLTQVVSKIVLGIIIDDQLRWDEQIDNITNKVSQGIGMLRRAKLFVKRETLQFLYNSMPQPYFEFGATAANP